MKANQVDAYRYFFPMGWIMGLWGVLLWILFPWKLVSYPGLHHPEIMSGGFILFFVCGFLMTAAPRFTSTHNPTPAEEKIVFLIIFSAFASLLPERKTLFYLVEVITFIFLAVFLFRRFIIRKSNPPDSFLFVGVGVGLGIVGSAALFLSQFFNTPLPIFTLARLFLLQAFILSLVLGVGSRIIPALLGWAPLPTESGKIKQNIFLFGALAFIFLTSYFLEAWSFQPVAYGLRSIVFSFIGFKFWKLHKFPRRKAVQSWGLWASAWLILICEWMTLILPEFRVHLLHGILVSGIGLMTFMIATRVLLSHGNHDLQFEKNSKALFFGALLIGFAGLTRLSAGFAPQIYQSHLLYAAYTWILGLIIWGAQFLPKIFRLNSSASDKI